MKTKGTIQSLPNRCDNALSRLQFRNAGVVHEELRFEVRERPCYYTEDLDVWSTAWSNATYCYLFEVRNGERIAPPNGMRSAVPLGGLGAGTIELRADGSLCDWSIFNNSPAGGGGKVHLDEALFGLRTKAEGADARAWVLRTHPPKGLPSVTQIEYAGAFPVSRLRFADADLPLAVDLYAYCELRIREPERSATPVVLFTFNLHNPLDQAIDTSLMFNLPNHVGGTYSAGPGLSLRREGLEPSSGTMALRVAGDNVSVSTSTGQELSTLWKEFAGQGSFGPASFANAAAAHGAVTVRVALAPHESRTVTFVLSWYFPYRPHGTEVPGNYYTNLFTSAEDVAGKVITRLPDTWDATHQWHQLCFDNSLPEWLQDAMANSMATMFKTGMWFTDGRWRQWESFSCAIVEPIHIHFYRSLPYVWFFPKLQQNLLQSYAEAQRATGYVQEHLADRESPDRPGGRQMGDGCTAFILALYQNYLWTGDEEFLDSLWPNAKKAAQWQIDRCAEHGLPNNLNNTYDWWEFEKKDVVAYNAFLHLAAMLAAEKLALVQGDTDFAAACRAGFESSCRALNDLLWTGGHFRAWWMEDQPFPDALHADTLYGQLWAFVLGLGWTVEPERIVSHLAVEFAKNASPFGLKVMQGTDCDADSHPDPKPGHAPYENGPVNNLVWQAGSLGWAALNLYAGEDPEQSLAEAAKVIEHWRKQLCDQWDYRDLTTGWDGYPWCNSHYGRQLILWAIPLALSGQQYSAPDKRLAFQPRLPAPARLPFFTPTANGRLDLVGDGTYRLVVLSGRLELNELRISGCEVVGPVSLAPGEKVVVLGDDGSAGPGSRKKR